MATSAVPVLVFLLLLPSSAPRDEEVGLLAELPLEELLAQMKAATGGNGTPGREPTAMPLLGGLPEREPAFESGHAPPARKTFYEDDYEEEKSPAHKKKKDKDKIHDILNTSISALSYLAFGGYLLCMIVSVLREKRRRIAMAYPPAGALQTNAHFANVLQHLTYHRPTRPFNRFPAVTLHQGGRRRRRRSATARGGREAVLNLVDQVPIFSGID